MESRRLASDNLDVIWEFSEENIGYLPARNRLMQMTKYKYYVSLDDDAWFVKGDELVAAINLLEEDENTAVVAFDILTPDRPDEEPRDREPYQVNSFIGCGHVIRLADFQAAGGYVKAVGYYGSEEKDLSIRLLDRGKKVVLMPGFHVWHDKSELGRDIFKQHRSEVCNDLVFRGDANSFVSCGTDIPQKAGAARLVFGTHGPLAEPQIRTRHVPLELPKHC